MLFRIFIVLSFFYLSSPLAIEPWGRDSDLIKPKEISPKVKKANFFNQVAQKMILFHKNVISPVDGPRSHFRPSSSSYTLEAIRRYGFLQGFLMGCDRLQRENAEPWVYPTIIDPENGLEFKYDPACLK